MLVRGIRGATTVASNTRDDILEAARELLDEIVRITAVERDHVASIMVKHPGDPEAEFPPGAGRPPTGVWRSYD